MPTHYFEKEITLTLQIVADVEPYHRASGSGSPDSSYPAEGGYATLVHAYLTKPGKSDEKIDVMPLLSKTEIGRIEDAAYNDFADSISDNAESEYEKRRMRGIE